ALQQIAAEPEDDARFRAVEADRIDERLDPLRGQPQHGGGGVGDRKESRGGGAGRGVLGAQRQDAGHEHAEGIALLLGDERERGSMARACLKCSSARARSPPASRGTSMSTLPASECARTFWGSSARIVSISRFTVGSRKSERMMPLVWPYRPVLIAYQTWASGFFGPSSPARSPP